MMSYLHGTVCLAIAYGQYNLPQGFVFVLQFGLMDTIITTATAE